MVGSDLQQEKSIARVHAAIEAARAGGMVIMVDDEDRENEGDLVLPAEFVAPSKINFMAKEARGLICLAMAPTLIEKLKLPMMNDQWKGSGERNTAFTVSIEAKVGVSTGISAADRSETVRIAIDDKTGPDDLVVPGHIFPLKAKVGGVLERTGHTEGSVDLARLAGAKPAAVICEIMNDDGTMARMPDLEKFAAKHLLPIVSIADLINYRLMRESLVRQVEPVKKIQVRGKEYFGTVFESILDGSKHLAIMNKEKFDGDIIDVRVHKQRVLLDVFGSTDGAGQHLHYSLELLSDARDALVIYLSAPDGAVFESVQELIPQEAAKSKQMRQKAQIMDERLYGIGAQIILGLGVKKMRIHVSTPRHLKALSGYGLEVVETVSMES